MSSRRAKVFIIFIALVAGAYVTGKLSRSTEAVPPDFKDARSQGAIVSENIVNLSNEITADLMNVSELEQAQKLDEALTLAVTLFEKSEKVKAEASELSVQLEKMTGALSDIDDPEARRFALESITDRMALIGRLISYSEYIKSLLMNLRNRISGLPFIDNTNALIGQINAEVIAINNFNRQASLAMEEFDRLTK